MSNALEKPLNKANETTSRDSNYQERPEPAIAVVLAVILWMLLAVAMAGCATQTKYIVHRIPCPPEPRLPMIMETELEQIGDEAYRRLVERELKLKAYIDQLQVACKQEQKK